ncbi:hypothetical protein TWF569_010183 [Orbilia oligospora]|nr:hypothetical protein TWF569_010183 [Orbilia oligospora]
MSNYQRRPYGRDESYAIANGRQIGVFDSYRDQVHPSSDRYPSNIHQRFSSREAAERALNRSGSSSSGNGRHYAVRNGRNPGIYPDWIRAAPEVLGHPHNEHRRFDNRSEAERYMNCERSGSPTPDSSSTSNYQTSWYSLSSEYGGRFDSARECASRHDTRSEYGDDCEERTGYASAEYLYNESDTNREYSTGNSGCNGGSGYGYSGGECRSGYDYDGYEDEEGNDSWDEDDDENDYQVEDCDYDGNHDGGDYGDGGCGYDNGGYDDYGDYDDGGCDYESF